MQIVASLAAVLGMAAFAQAHMALTYPPPMRSPKNKHTTDIDYDLTSPLNADGSNFPCKGTLNLVGTPQGAAVDDWAAGSSQTLSIDGSAWHSGGSCQASLSYDKGKTWTVIHSWLGSCPTGPSASSYDFKVPSDAPAGEAIFAWSWFNEVGNREMYMNCAVINIKGNKSKKRRGIPMSQRPAMFVANVGNGCGTTEGVDLELPDPGEDVTRKDSKFGPPVGNCATGNPAPGPAPGPAPEKPSSSPAAANPTKVPTPTQPGGIFVTVSDASTARPSASSTSIATPTTIQISISTPAGAPPAGTPPAGTPPAAAPPATTSSAPTAAPTSGGNGGAFPAGAACDDLGSWNCIGGKEFQRCSSGNRWSVAQQLAAGTSCKPGVAKVISFV
ncbi:extracellular protein [Beauveria bassiana ARSEF 2860]|uniref:Extracellular protein n=1 Tax=Beauveria bassiana (strain ARSEF 2860) TaxID=655819 RepID=J4W5M0_BEAB2|nr:extracellular protein [Beauveria bassiana ARSEF 2860]EJP65660.1 extracellular protein [Beauveria bassiana ARSEF 2860]